MLMPCGLLAVMREAFRLLLVRLDIVGLLEFGHFQTTQQQSFVRNQAPLQFLSET